MVVPVFYEASGTSARDHPCGTDHVEACRPQGYVALHCSYLAKRSMTTCAPMSGSSKTSERATKPARS